MNKLFAGIILVFSFSIVFATDIAQVPIGKRIQTKPNIIFGLDDSGSMDSEVLMPTNDGALWWDKNSESFTDADGNLYFNSKGSTGSNGAFYWYKYVYLFPNGHGGDRRIYRDSSRDHYAIAPTPEFAYTRSHAYNPIYYNSKVTYTPWVPAYIDGATVSFADSLPTAARSHPTKTYNGTPTTMNLTVDQFSTDSNKVFRMHDGMTVPGADIPGIKVRLLSTSLWVDTILNVKIPAGQTWEVAIPYYPATFYEVDPTCTGGANCAEAPDGTHLRRYEIKPGNTFPSGRSYAEEMQNFANWFTYYRKRKLMIGAAMGQVFEDMRDIRGGITRFNNLSNVSMYDFSSTTDSANGRALLGKVYDNPSNGGTNTRNTLHHIGQQYITNSSIIQNACQVNAAMLLTDGYANVTNPSIPSYNASTWGSGGPYSTIYPKSLADIALAYYTLNLKPSLPTGLVPVNPSDTAPSADKNNNLHMNTYAFSLGPIGTIYGTGTPQATDPYNNAPSWPEPINNRHPSGIDDLWHATINGRGLMFNANNVSDTISKLKRILFDVIQKAGASASIEITNVFIGPDSKAFVSSYNSNYGNLIAAPISSTTGEINLSAPLWSARSQLETLTWDARKIVTFSGFSGVPFRTGDITSQMANELVDPANTSANNTSENVLRWLRGDRTHESSTFRTRTYLLGDVVHAKPLYVAGPRQDYADASYQTFKTTYKSRKPMLYQPANDGMLHAINATTGKEEWAYVPKLVFDNLHLLPSKNYNHRFYVDASPVVGDVKVGGNWKTILVGGLRAGGHGYYAVDVTNPNLMTSENNIAGKILWEFPNASTPQSVKDAMGLSYGKPLIVNTKAYGWVVVVTSGYNNADGLGHVFVLNPETGELIKDLKTTAGTPANPSGLAQLSAFSYNARFGPTIESIYGGDLLGNVWRFDLSGESTADWNVKHLVTVKDAGNNVQPITTEPELGLIQGKRFIYVGTGQLLGLSDVNSTATQSMYAIVDDLTSSPSISNVRTELVPRTFSGAVLTGTEVDYASKRGWYFDLPDAGERINVNPSIAYGLLVFSSNRPIENGCGTESYLYVVDLYSGLPRLTLEFGDAGAWNRRYIGKSLTSAPSLIVLPNGKTIAINHNADNTITSIEIPQETTNAVDVVAWKEIYKK